MYTDVHDTNGDFPCSIFIIKHGTRVQDKGREDERGPGKKRAKSSWGVTVAQTTWQGWRDTRPRPRGDLVGGETGMGFEMLLDIHVEVLSSSRKYRARVQKRGRAADVHWQSPAHRQRLKP